MAKVSGLRDHVQKTHIAVLLYQNNSKITIPLFTEVHQAGAARQWRLDAAETVLFHARYVVEECGLVREKIVVYASLFVPSGFGCKDQTHLYTSIQGGSPGRSMCLRQPGSFSRA